MDARTIIDAVRRVTKKWCKQRKAEERDAARAQRRYERLTARGRDDEVKAAAWQVMEQAYLKASSGGTLPAGARQIMYAARPAIQAQTGKPLDDKYFTQKLLPDYLNAHPEQTKGWDVTFDARGHFIEPHTEKVVPLGTLDVREYLAQVAEKGGAPVPLDAEEEITLPKDFPTWGPANRFQAILFIEKEGFLSIFEAVNLAQRYDIAIMSTKGLSVTASRTLVDRLCGEYGIPLLILRDWDKAGFSGVATFTRRKTRRYEYRNQIEVIDLGLRLEDIRAWGLELETVVYKSSPVSNLQKNGATQEEIEILYDAEQSGEKGSHVGQRCELNEFASADLVRWIESKFEKHGIKKVVPDRGVLEVAYRRAFQTRLQEERLAEIAEEVRQEAQEAKLPANLRKKVRDALKRNPEKSWDAVIAELVVEGS
jgi:hypothetical protein